MPAVHYRVGVGGPTLTNPTACGQGGFNVTDTQLVTCFVCLHTTACKEAATQFREVVDALAYPKEDHPCLTQSTRRT